MQGRACSQGDRGDAANRGRHVDLTSKGALQSRLPGCSGSSSLQKSRENILDGLCLSGSILLSFLMEAGDFVPSIRPASLRGSRQHGHGLLPRPQLCCVAGPRLLWPPPAALSLNTAVPGNDPLTTLHPIPLGCSLCSLEGPGRGRVSPGWGMSWEGSPQRKESGRWRSGTLRATCGWSLAVLSESSSRSHLAPALLLRR